MKVMINQLDNDLLRAFLKIKNEIYVDEEKKLFDEVVKKIQEKHPEWKN